jgi:hypothetical protein
MRKAVLIGCALGLVACSSAGGRTPDSGIAGRVVESPTCPVETVPPQPQCAPRPLAVGLRVTPVGRNVGRLVRSGPDGRFRVLLSPGTYIVKGLPKNGSPFPRPLAPRRVGVQAGRLTRITITYDSGIR